MSRMTIDCRSIPSESGCSLSISGEEDEVMRAATAHAVDVHGHTDDDDLRSALRASLVPDVPPITLDEGAFVQVIEFRTSRLPEFQEIEDRWRDAIGSDRTARWAITGADRDHTGPVRTDRRLPRLRIGDGQLEAPRHEPVRRAARRGVRRRGRLPRPGCAPGAGLLTPTVHAVRRGCGSRSARPEDRLGAAEQRQRLAGLLGRHRRVPHLRRPPAVSDARPAGDRAVAHRAEVVRLELDRREAGRSLGEQETAARSHRRCRRGRPPWRRAGSRWGRADRGAPRGARRSRRRGRRRP